MNQQQERETNRLKAIYPLFEITAKDCKAEPPYSDEDFVLITAQESKGSSFSCRMNKNGRVDHESTTQLDIRHMQMSLKKAFMEQYPDLYFGVYAGKDGVSLSAWVERDGRDREAIGEIDITKAFLHTILANWQAEAQKAKQDGWFFCSGHQRAESKANYGYFYNYFTFSSIRGIIYSEYKKGQEKERVEMKRTIDYTFGTIIQQQVTVEKNCRTCYFHLERTCDGSPRLFAATKLGVPEYCKCWREAK